MSNEVSAYCEQWGQELAEPIRAWQHQLDSLAAITEVRQGAIANLANQASVTASLQDFRIDIVASALAPLWEYQATLAASVLARASIPMFELPQFSVGALLSSAADGASVMQTGGVTPTGEVTVAPAPVHADVAAFLWLVATWQKMWNDAGRYGQAGLKVRRALLTFLALIIVTFVLDSVLYLDDRELAALTAGGAVIAATQATKQD